MIKVTLEIDNLIASPYSPLEFLRRYILQDAYSVKSKDYDFITTCAKIKVVEIEQI